MYNFKKKSQKLYEQIALAYIQGDNQITLYYDDMATLLQMFIKMNNEEKINKYNLKGCKGPEVTD